jgi:hypothetical protein
MGHERLDRALDLIGKGLALLGFAIAIGFAVWLATSAGGQ